MTSAPTDLQEQLTRLTDGQRNLEFFISQLHWRQALHTDPRYKDTRALAGYGYRVYSASDEDGIIDEIFQRIGEQNRRFVECGVGNGLENNTLYRLLRGWRGAWFELGDRHIETIQRTHQDLVAPGRLSVHQTLVTAENIETLLRESAVPHDFDLLSIDVDGNDYWVWKAIENYRPRVVVIEYNAALGPRAEWRHAYDPRFAWRGTRDFGASLKTLELLGREKGYSLVGCNFTGVNAFFVRDDLVGDGFLQPFTAERHWEPPKYSLKCWSGHPRDPREIGSFPSVTAAETGRPQQPPPALLQVGAHQHIHPE